MEEALAAVALQALGAGEREMGSVEDITAVEGVTTANDAYARWAPLLTRIAVPQIVGEVRDHLPLGDYVFIA